jgi:hypothetical protein
VLEGAVERIGEGRTGVAGTPQGVSRSVSIFIAGRLDRKNEFRALMQRIDD